MESLSDLLQLADPKDIKEYENITKQIESVETYEELMPLLRNRAKVISRILKAPLQLLEEQRTE